MATESLEYLEPEIGRSLCRVRRQNGNLGGYRTDLLVENISKTEMAALVCKRCQGILRKACFSATSGEYFCKCCKNLLEPAEPNEQVRKIVHSLKSSCPLYDRGCEGIGKLVKCAKHLNICEFVYEQCELGCEIVLPRHELKIHMREHCAQREITCEYCDQYFKVCEMGYHMNQCDKMQLTSELGCGTVMCRKNMAQHLENYCLGEEKCELGCGIVLPRHELKIHVREKCNFLKILCEHCQRDFKACDMSNHLVECPKLLLACELGCSTVACREDMARHPKEECVEMMMECPFRKYKCEIGLIKRKELNQHLKEKRTEHTELKLSAMEEIVTQKSKMNNKQDEMIAKQNELISKQKEIIKAKNRFDLKQGKEIKEQKDLISKQGKEIKEHKGLISKQGEEIKQQMYLISKQGEEIKEHKGLISKQDKEIKQQMYLISKQGKEIKEQKDLHTNQSTMIEQLSQRFITPCSVTKTTHLEWRFQNLGGRSYYENLEVAGFKFGLDYKSVIGVSNAVSISLHFPPQVISKATKLEWPFRAIFVIRLLCHIKPCDPWEFTSKLIEVKQKDCTKNQYSCQLVEMPANNEIFLRDGGINLQISVVLQ